jgi:ABC-type multidrug transport system ATPase subunit
MSDDLRSAGPEAAGPTLRVAGKEFAWRPGAVITVGRDRGCDIVVDDPRVSRAHLRVEATEDGGWRLCDAGSRNGVFLGGSKVETVAVIPAMRVNLGAPDGVPLGISAERAVPGRQDGRPPLAADGARPGSRLGRSVGTFVPGKDVVRIGREESNDLVLAGDPRASRRHAELRRLPDGGWEVRDLGSHNGTFVNGKRVSRARLAEEDLLTLGNHIFVFRDGRLDQLSEADDTSLDVIGVTVTVPGGVTLLSDVSFSLPARSVLAVVGPSGAGKTTLLGALTGALTPSRGQVCFAGRDLHSAYEEFRSRIGLVPQDDLVHPELTARAELELAAELRLPPDTGRAARRARVQQVLAELGLAERADLPISKLSGGQRKRVSVGTELLTEPTLLFLDEPTSGLDPGNEKQVMSVLRQLADGGRVVVVVTHATQSLDLADRVLFLTRGGRVAYFGPPAGALGFFARHGAAGGYADIFRALDEPGDVDWAARFRADPDHDRYVGLAVRQAAVRRGTPARRVSLRGASPVPPRDQLRVLIKRQLLVLRGDRRSMLLLAAQPLAFGVIIAAIFQSYTLSTSQGPFASLMLWLLVISATWLGASGTIREIVKELPVFRRERAVGLSIPAYVGSKFAVFGGITVIQSFAVVLIGLIRQSLPPQDHQHFIPRLLAFGPRVAPAAFRSLRPYAEGSFLPSQRLEIAVAVALAGIAGTALGLLVSAAVRKSDQAVLLLPVVLVVEMALSLPLLQLHNPSPVISDLANITSANWGMSAVASTVSLDQLLTPYQLDLADGTAEVNGIITTGRPLPPPRSAILSAVRGAPAWRHTTATWLTAASIMVIMAAVLLVIAVFLLRRQDIGRQGGQVRRGALAARPQPAAAR